jgi:ABC-type glycerol-3-phosphate transport system substrate-binding protein
MKQRHEIFTRTDVAVKLYKEEKMKKMLIGMLAAAVMSSNAVAADKVTIEVGYPYSHLFDVTFQKIMPGFNAAHPDIEVKFRATYENYEDATNTVLREAVAGNLPDVTMQGFQLLAVMSMACHFQFHCQLAITTKTL